MALHLSTRILVSMTLLTTPAIAADAPATAPAAPNPLLATVDRARTAACRRSTR